MRVELYDERIHQMKEQETHDEWATCDFQPWCQVYDIVSLGEMKDLYEALLKRVKSYNEDDSEEICYYVLKIIATGNGWITLAIENDYC